MNTEPTMGELTEFIKEYLPRGFALKVAFARGEGMTVSLVDLVRGVLEAWDNDPDDLAATVVNLVNMARAMVDLEPVEGAWDQK